METALIPAEDDYLSLSHLSATICAELAAGLTDADGIKRKYELTEGQWRKLKGNDMFRAMLKDALIKFKGDIGAPARIKMKAEILLEDSLPVLDSIVHAKDGGAGTKLEAVKQLTVLAEKSGGGKGAEKGEMTGAGFNVSIHINTGEGNEAAAPTTIVNIPAEDIKSMPLLEEQDEASEAS